MADTGSIIALCISNKKGIRKHEIETAEFRENFGIQGDAHAGTGRQVSLLALESIEIMREKKPDIAPGDFAENIVTSGLDLSNISVGTRIRIGKNVILEITQIGKECHDGCEISQIVGYCIMPTQGLFARVINGGTVQKGDPVEIE